MSSTESLLYTLHLVVYGLSASCIVGVMGSITASGSTYCYIVEWIERLWRGDSDTIIITLLFLSVVSGYGIDLID